MAYLNTLVTYKDKYDEMVRSAKGIKYYIAKREYTDEEYDAVIAEANNYVVYTDNEEIKYIVTEKDATPVTSNTVSYIGNPKKDEILVKDGKFAGIMVYCQHESETYMIYSLDDEGYGIVLTTGECAGIYQDSFSFNPGDRKLINTYSLATKEEWEQINNK